MNPATTILTSVVVSAVVASIFNLFGQAAERRARKKELLFQKTFELAQANREFLLEVSKTTGKTTSIADYVEYAVMYYWLLEALYHKGKLPEGWQEKTKDITKKTFGKD